MRRETTISAPTGVKADSPHRENLMDRKHNNAILLSVTRARIEKDPMALIFYPKTEKEENGTVTWETTCDSFEWTMFGFGGIKVYDVAEWLRIVADVFEENYTSEDVF